MWNASWNRVTTYEGTCVKDPGNTFGMRQTRLFLLDVDGTLAYFDAKGEMKGEIQVRNYDLKPTNGGFKLIYSSTGRGAKKGRTYTLRTPQYQEWLAVLEPFSRASYAAEVAAAGSKSSGGGGGFLIFLLKIEFDRFID